MCIERNRDTLFWVRQKAALGMRRRLPRHATCPAKSYYTCHTGDSGFSSFTDIIPASGSLETAPNAEVERRGPI